MPFTEIAEVTVVEIHPHVHKMINAYMLVNTMAADDLANQGASTSVSIVSTDSLFLTECFSLSTGMFEVFLTLNVYASSFLRTECARWPSLSPRTVINPFLLAFTHR